MASQTGKENTAARLVESIPLLPRLVSGKGVGIENPGEWNEKKEAILSVVANSLEVQERDVAIHSVPDIWAKPLIFEMALTGPSEHPSTELATAEWRGILAMIALRQWRGIGSYLRLVQPFSSSRGLSAVAEQLLPDRLLPTRKEPNAWQNSSVSPSTRWKDISVIVLNQAAVAMTSPSTLVCPAADTPAMSLSGLPWFKGGYFTDPIGHLSPVEREGLTAWLLAVQEKLKLECDGAKWRSLQTILAAYIRDLASPPTDKTLQKVVEAKDTDDLVGLATGIFRSLSLVLETDTKAPSDSQVKLLGSRLSVKPKAVKAADGAEGGPAAAANSPAAEEIPEYPQILLIDSDISRQLNRPAESILVIGHLPLSAALADIETNTERNLICGTKIAHDGCWKRSGDFFTDKLYVIQTKDALSGQRKMAGSDEIKFQGDPATPLLPFPPWLLDHFTAAELVQRLTFETKEKSNVIAALRLPLTGGEVRISREYTKDEIIGLGRPPIVEVWPYFASDKWKAYYCLYDDANDAARVFARPYIYGQTLTPKQIRPIREGQSEGRLEITKMPKLPEALICSNNQKGHAGIIAVEQPTPLTATGGHWNIGIDFGTTGTTVFSKRTGGSTPAALTFRAWTKKITNPSDADRSRVYDHFFPTGPENGGTLLSIFHDFYHKINANVIVPIEDGHIYFVNNVDRFKATDKGIATNMKWGDSRDRARAEAFLQQLCLQSAAEAVSEGATEVSWRFSFPTSFSTADRDFFQKTWTKVVKHCSAETGLGASLKDNENYIRKNESLATAIYFLSQPKIATLISGAVCIDIGGGTSDIAVWQGNNPVAQASVRLAGRDIFLHPLFLRPHFLRIFGQDTTKLSGSKGGGELAFYNQLDVLLRDRGQQLAEQLNASSAIPIVSEFLGLLDIGLSGLFHYVGLMINRLVTDKKYDPKALPHIYVGGNGSKMLDWAAGGRYQKDLKADNKFKRVFYKATGFPKPLAFNIHLSQEPKSEVAHGLLIDELETSGSATEPNYMEEAAAEVDPPLVAGENFTSVGGKRTLHDWSDYLSAQDAADGLLIDDKLPMFQQFLTACGLKEDESGLRNCHERANQALLQYRRMDVKEIRLEPLFITALKALLAARADEWSTRDASEKERG